MKQFKNIVILAVIGFALIYANMPVINYGFIGFAAIIVVLAAGWMLINSTDAIKFDQKTNKAIISKKLPKLPIAIIILLLIYIFIIPAVTSWPLLRNQAYRNLIGKIETGENFSQQLTPISIEKIRVVDRPLAYLLGDKVLGAQPALGSQVVLGDFSIQRVKDGLYWVAPLVHSGFFKWQKNSAGTNGYVMVNATNERDVKLVQEVQGKPIRIKYQPDAFFQDNLERHVYFNGYMTAGLTDYTFEIDDQGMPYWVITKYKKRVGFSGDDAVAVVVVEAGSGKITEYAINQAPAWIDRIQPEPFIQKQLDDWGKYVKGYWNFSNEEKLQTTEGLTMVYGEDNKAYWYTGLTSVGADESTVGFVLIDTRTKKAVWYRQSGATEFAAQKSAVGKVQEKGYSASMPIPYNINNIPTYIMTLKDKGGLVKMYAMVAIEDYTIVGVGNSLQETLMAYKNAFNMAGNKIDAKSIAEKTVLNSVITRINSDIKNGNSFYYLTVKESKNIFIGSTQISNDLPITSVGDSVEISFDNEVGQLIGISSFKNKTVNK